MREFCEFRAKCGLLWCYDWVSIPMVYTQVVTLATYVFFIFTIIGRQKLEGYGQDKRMPSGRLSLDIDLYIPIFTVLQFFFYMGLLKVAEQLINPFGDDDEDFELNWLIDRHVKASFLGCDVLMNPERIPPLVKDFYWDKQDCPIPYTEASMHFKKKTYRGSADDMKVPEDKCHMVLPEIEEEEEEGPKLSLTSLLLGKEGGSDYTSPNPLSYDRSPATGSRPIQPGAWRNGHPAGSWRDLLNSRRVSESEEDEEERRGSLPYNSSRRGSKIQDFLKYNQEKKRRKDKWFKDKQGFVWRRMVQPEEYVPISRTPQPHLQRPALSHLQPGQVDPPDPSNHQNPQQSQHLAIKRLQMEKIESIDTDEPDETGGSGDSYCRPAGLRGGPVPRHPGPRDGSLPELPLAVFADTTTAAGQAVPTHRDPDTCSLHSIRSENSFKTCSSEPQLNLVPRQVSDTYNNAPSERSAQERKASFRALKQQYSILHAVNNNGAVGQHKQGISQNKTVR